MIFCSIILADITILDHALDCMETKMAIYQFVRGASK